LNLIVIDNNNGYKKGGNLFHTFILWHLLQEKKRDESMKRFFGHLAFIAAALVLNDIQRYFNPHNTICIPFQQHFKL